MQQTCIQILDLLVILALLFLKLFNDVSLSLGSFLLAASRIIKRHGANLKRLDLAANRGLTLEEVLTHWKIGFHALLQNIDSSKSVITFAGNLTDLYCEVRIER